MPQLVLLPSADFPAQPATGETPRWPPVLCAVFIAGCAVASWVIVIGIGVMVGRLI